MKTVKTRLSQSFQRWLILMVSVAFLTTTFFLWIIQTGLSENNAIRLLTRNVSDVHQDILDASDENLLRLGKSIAEELNAAETVSAGLLHRLAADYDVTEINVIGPDGIIFATTHPDFLNYDMRTGSQSTEFICLLDGETAYVQSYQPTSHDPSISRKYGAVLMENGCFVQVRYGAERFQRDIDAFVTGVTRNRHVGESGCIIIADENMNIVSDRFGNEGRSLSVTVSGLIPLPLQKVKFLPQMSTAVAATACTAIRKATIL